MFFSIVIVSLNGAAALPLCLRSIFAIDSEDYEVIVVDNGSTDDTSKVVKEGFPKAELIRSERNLGFAGGNNVGIDAAKGDVVVLLNDDTEVHPNYFKALRDAASRLSDWGVLGCKLLYPDKKTIQHAGAAIKPNAHTMHFGNGETDEGQYDEIRECDYVTGAAFAINRRALDAIGALDAGYFPIYFEEVDYCFRAKKAGLKSYYIPDAVVYHYESRTTKVLSFGFYVKYNKNRIRFVIKNYTFRELLRFAKNEVKWFYENKPFDLLPSLIVAYLYNLLNLPRTLCARYTKR